jgi:hypothetical protein
MYNNIGSLISVFYKSAANVRLFFEWAKKSLNVSTFLKKRKILYNLQGNSHFSVLV